jgi:hypothetical protein
VRSRSTERKKLREKLDCLHANPARAETSSASQGLAVEQFGAPHGKAESKTRIDSIRSSNENETLAEKKQNPHHEKPEGAAPR